VLSLAILIVAADVAAQKMPQLADQAAKDRSLKPMSDAQVFLRWDQLIEGGQSLTQLVARLGDQHGNPKNYANSVFVSTSTSCTATLIGPHALMTAQHCVIGDGPLTLATKPTDTTAWCVKYRYYSPESSEDLALCWIERALPSPWETVSFDSSLAAKDQTLAIGGYGLTGQTGSATGKEFVLGMTTVFDPGPEIIVTHGAKVRIGDSGGPAFAITADKKRRFLVAVTGQESLQDKETSYLTALAFQRARAFVDWWKTQQMQVFQRTVQICGIDKITGCE